LRITQVCDGECVSVGKEVIHTRHPRGSRSSKWPACLLGLTTSLMAVADQHIARHFCALSSSSVRACPTGDTNVGVLVRRKGEVELRSNHAGLLLDSGRGKFTPIMVLPGTAKLLAHNPMFLLVCITVRGTFRLQMPPQPSRSPNGSNKWKSATRPRPARMGSSLSQRLRETIRIAMP